MWFVYIIRCKDNSLYTGVTTDVTRRLKEHNGLTPHGAKYTLTKRPVKLVYTEEAVDRSSAQKREHAIKSFTKEYKNQLILHQK